MADGDIVEGVVDTEVQLVQAELKVRNFAAACALPSDARSPGNKFKECVSGPLLDAQTTAFGIGVAWGVLETGAPDLAQNVGIFITCLRKDSPDVRPTIRLALSLINRNEALSIHKRDTRFLSWGPQHVTGGWSPFRGAGNTHAGVTLNQLLVESNGWLHDGALIIRAKLEFVPTVSKASIVKVQDGQPAVCNSLKALLTSGDFSDVVITVGGERLHAHSLILCARSPVFRTMLSSPMKEGLGKEVDIKDIAVDVMKGFLDYLYTGKLEMPSENEDFISGLLQAAHRFELKELVQESEQVMTARISVTNAAAWFELADLLSCQDLRAACLRCIHENLAAVQGTEGYEQLVERRPSLLKDIIAAVTPPVKSGKPPPKRRKK